MKKNLFVTEPFLPSLSEFIPYLEDIWNSKILTNGGPMHQQLEQELCDYLGVKYICLFNNATIALITALQALRVQGEVITTPYSFVATAHSLMWNGIKPVFADIDPHTFNIDASKIESLITPQTTAIMPVHCYGQPCDVDAIQAIADNYNLRVIYDAAHAFAVRDASGSILLHGDLSVLSFHATKVFNTFEGGAIICADEKMKRRIDNLKNFGIVDETTVVAAGINGKMSEFNAALGLLQLKHIDKVISARGAIDQMYRELLENIPGISCLPLHDEVVANYSYFPISVGPAYPMSRDQLYDKLRQHQIYGRRYFYPLISEFPMYRGLRSAGRDNLPVASKVSDTVICLPISPGLHENDVKRVVECICGSNN